MSKYSGFVDPSLYAVIINAQNCGWVPRPPSIPLTNSKDVFTKLRDTSSLISENGKLDLRFATSLHERKHFLDLHLSTSLWQSFLSWFHCASQIFTIVSLLKGKTISVPLFSHLGTLRDDNAFSLKEQDIINGICLRIFTNHTPQRLKYALEMSASLLQYSIFHDEYRTDEGASTASKQYYELFYLKPVELFSGDITKAFCCYTFLSWFCSDYREIEEIERLFLTSTDVKKTTSTLLQDGYYPSKQDEISTDIQYLNECSDYFHGLAGSHFPDLAKFLSELINFRKEVFSSIDSVVNLLTDMPHFKKWITNDTLKVHYLVDFGKPLSLDTEITKNYYVSKWIVENQQFLHYDDQIGKQILAMNDYDDLINIQLLSSFLISPVRLFHFRSKIANAEFLECEFVNKTE